MDAFIAATKGCVAATLTQEWADTLRAFNRAHEDIWAITPLCGHDNKLHMVRSVLQLLHKTVESNRMVENRSLGLEVEAEALLAARILLRERSGAEELMNHEALKIYVEAAREEGDGDANGGYRVSLMALKCINNAVWDQPAGQLSFVRLQGLEVVTRLLETPRPASILYFACRILNVVGTSAPSAFDELKRDHDLLLVFSSVLAWCVRCKNPPFPYGEDRLKLMVQVLQALFLLDVRFTKEERTRALEGDTMKRLGYVLVDALHLDHAQSDVFKAKLQVLNLLLDMPLGFASVLMENGCLPRILQLVEFQLTCQGFQDRADMDPAAELTPALLVLNKLVEESGDIRISVKNAVFPPEADKVWKKKLQEEHEKLRSLSGEEREHAEKTANDRRVHPVDAPPGSLRARIFVQMTSTETSSKIAASDLLFNLCDDEEEFTTRCGFGNAINTLRMKGHILMPGVQ